MTTHEKAKANIIVTGDLVVDHHIYHGARDSPMASHERGVHEWRQLGGAAILKELLAAVLAAASDTSWDVQFGTNPVNLYEGPFGHHTYTVWKQAARADASRDVMVWRVELAMGYGKATSAPNAEYASQAPSMPARILVLDDAGADFRLLAQKSSWQLPESGSKPEWILLSMLRPLAQGDLWHVLINDFADRLVCVVTVDDLRHECVNISRALSWEQTVEDIRDGIASNPVLSELNRCRHLIITFAADGALWIDHSDRMKPRTTLSFDAAGVERERESSAKGAAKGYSTIMSAAIAYCMTNHSTQDFNDTSSLALAPAIDAGLSAMRDFRELGHGSVGNVLPTGFPIERLAKVIVRPTESFAHAVVPWSEDRTSSRSTNENWSIVESSQRALGSQFPPSLVGLARQVILQGRFALKRLPHAVFGGYTTADRTEIEALRNFKRLMLSYREQANVEKPLSFGVFGPPGAGKSFGVKQIALESFGKDAWLTFNLSQFNGPADLIGAFHQVRDVVLSNKTPVVFWDEFDSRQYEWLQYLLAPLQDGKFQQGQLSHSVGKCVFIFAGGTSSAFDEFGPPDDTDISLSESEAVRQFKLRKGPDFISRLDAYYDVAGPNQRLLPRSDRAKANEPELDPKDTCYPLRRALAIRGMLKCEPDERLDFDSDLIDALLLVPKYKHGTRSLEKLMLSLKGPKGAPIRRSSLPSSIQMKMHVNYWEFTDILNRNQGFKMSAMIEALAEGIHRSWRKHSQEQGSRMELRFDKPYKELESIDQEDNRAAARRIPEVLALAGMGISDGKATDADEPSDRHIRDHVEHHLERLAEAEHDGWMQHRVKNGWRSGPRDDINKRHPRLVPYSDLPEEEKRKDRNSVLNFAKTVADANYRIVWLKA